MVLPSIVGLRFRFESDLVPSGTFEVVEFQGTDEIFDCYKFEIDLVSERDDIDLHSLLDTSAVLMVTKPGISPRYFHGIIAEVEKRDSGFTRTFYHVVLRPSLYRLNYTSDSRIFQNETAPEIVKTLFAENGLADVDTSGLTSKYEVREYCVCYKETLFDFMRRLFAEEGIIFWFAHSRVGHKLFISDAPQSMPMLPEMPVIPFNGTPGGVTQESWIGSFSQIERVRATARVASDYSFENPGANEFVEARQSEAKSANKGYQLYQYPGRFKDAAVGKVLNEIALQAHRVEATSAQGETNCIYLRSGYIFTLTNHPVPAANANHRLVKVKHEGRQFSALEEDAPDDAATSYRASFTCQPARLPYRGICPNPRPSINEHQIAHVTGPENEVIYCDEYGRVKVWFPWDRYGKKDENSSCWVRVMQYAAGNSMGSVAVPRVGDEVVVIFLDGDPDRPIISGCTYNATNMMPYPLPEHKTKTVIRANSVGGTGYNELRFENKAGSEQVRLHTAGKKVEIIAESSTDVQTGTGTVGVAEVDRLRAGFNSVAGLMTGCSPILSLAQTVVVANSMEAGKELLKNK